MAQPSEASARHSYMRRRGHRLAPATLAVAVVAMVTACAPAHAVVHRGSPQPLHAGSLTSADVGSAQRAFTVDLLHAVCATKTEGNVLVSGTSAAEALGLLYAAAHGPTADAVGKLLHLPAWDTAVVAAVAGHTQALDSIRGPKKDEGLFLSNHVWSAKGNSPTQQYLDDVATAYGSDARMLDFGADAQGATDAINHSVDADTVA